MMGFAAFVLVVVAVVKSDAEMSSVTAFSVFPRGEDVTPPASPETEGDDTLVVKL